MYKTAVIGAGRVGTSLGLYFFDEKNLKLEGFFSRTKKSAEESSKLTGTRTFENIEDAVKSSDLILITTPDKEIKNVWDEIKNLDLKDKIICHCSGSLSSDIFKREDKDFSCASMHPALAFSSKENSYKDLDGAFFTLEGDKKAIDLLSDNLKRLSNPYKILDTKDKSGYHLATVCISNMVIGLGYMASKLLKTYGFSEEDSLKALEVLGKKNLNSFFSKGSVNSLTGPVDRGDLNTVKSHIDFLEDHDMELEKDIYMYISKLLLEIAQKKNPKRDYDLLEHELEK